jgi:hypothetical protein
MKNVIRVVGAAMLLLTISALFWSSPVATAQTPLNTPTPAPAGAPPLAAVNTDDPGRAIVIPNAPQVIQPGQAEWFRFDYTTNNNTVPRPAVTVELLVGMVNGLQFEVYTQEQIKNVWYDFKPTGRGTQEVVIDCTNASDITGHCGTTNLIWTGGLGLDGSVYVRVINNTGTAVGPQLIVAGGGVAACYNAQPPAQPAQTNQPYTMIQCNTAMPVPPVPAS